MATVEEILKAARNRGKSKEITLAPGATITVRELSASKKRELYERMYEKGSNGEFVVVDKDGNPSSDGKGFYKPKEGVRVMREWLLAAMTPVEAVDGILSDDVPDSVQMEIYHEALRLNDIEVQSTIAKNS